METSPGSRDVLEPSELRNAVEVDLERVRNSIHCNTTGYVTAKGGVESEVKKGVAYLHVGHVGSANQDDDGRQHALLRKSELIHCE